MKFINIFYFSLFFIQILSADCSDLNYDDCEYWGCYWNDETQECSEVGGGGEIEYGPYTFSLITEADGLRNGPDYNDGLLFYPDNAELPYKPIIFTPGYGGGSSTMSVWGEIFASYGFISLVIGPNDQENDSWEQRAFGLIDAVSTIKAEHFRIGSPLYNIIDTTGFIIAGYSMGGGASQVALTLESQHQDVIKGSIALNPTLVFEDCNACSEYNNCFCIIPEFLNHEIPTLIIDGQNALNDLDVVYDGFIGQDIYANTPETTLKVYYEIENGGHGSAEFPEGNIIGIALTWASYLLIDNESFCESLLVFPDDASQYSTTLQCGESFSYDFNEDGDINNADLVLLVIAILNSSEIDFDINNDQSTNIFDLLIFSSFLNNI